jgi:hypothetical protein
MSFTRPVFSSPVTPGWNGDPRASSGLRTPPLPATHARVETGPEHGPGTTLPTTSVGPPIRVFSHLVRPSCRTAVVCCWTGTGASIAANKVPGIRAALCADGTTAAGARRWNDANVLAQSLRTTSEAVLGEILDAWFAAEPSANADDRANIAHVDEIHA